MSRFLRLVVPCVLLVGVLGTAGPAHAAPANDSIAAAIVIPVDQLPFSPAGYSTAGATLESNEPSPTCALSGAGASVWYKWIDPSGPADLTITTAGSTNGPDQLDTVLSAFHQTSGQYILDACNDDSSGDSNQAGLRTSSISFQAAQNTTYFIQITGSRGRDGVTPETGTLRFSVSRRPLNDDFRNALEAKTLPFTDARNVSGATEESTEPSPDCPGRLPKATVWYRYTSTRASLTSAPFFADTFGSTYDTVLSAFRQTPNGLTPVGCSDDDSGTQQSRLELAITAGEYWFQVSSKTLTGVLQFHFGEQPLNDRFTGATTLTGVSSTLTQVTSGAGRESGEPTPSCVPAGNTYGASVWFTLVVDPGSTDLPVTIDTIGSNYNTVLALWTGPALTSLVAQGCSTGLNAKLSVSPSGLTTFAIQVSSTGPSSGSAAFAGGTLVLNVPPVNNDLAAAKAATVFPYSDTVSTIGATSEPTEKSTACATAGSAIASVWYQVAVPVGATPQTYTVYTNDLDATKNSTFDTIVSVFASSSPNEITCNDDYGNAAPRSRAQFVGQPGVTYLIRVAGKANATGTLLTKIFQQPACDTIAGACAASKPFSVVHTPDQIAAASVEASEPGAPCIASTPKNSLWYRYTATTNGVLYADTVGSKFNTVLLAYNSTTPSSASRIACNASATDSRISFATLAGTTYLFQIAGVGDAVEALAFHITPDNNDIAAAITLPTIPYASGASTSTVGATAEPGEPTPSDGSVRNIGCTSGPSATIWYKVVVAAPTTLTANTAGSDYDTVLGVYQLNGSTLTAVGCNNDVEATSTSSSVTFNATGGSTYLFQVGGNADKDVSQTGNAKIGLTAAPPANDAADNASRIGTMSATGTGLRISDTRGTYGATYSGEPAPGCATAPGATIWYAYTAGAKLKFDVDTATSNFNTFLAVYAVPTPLGPPTAGTQALACSADAGTPGTAHVGFTTVPGVTYYIQVGGVNAATGKAVVNMLSRPSL